MNEAKHTHDSAAPVVLPEPAEFQFRVRSNAAGGIRSDWQECSKEAYENKPILRGWEYETRNMYTEQQVRALLAGVSAPAAQAINLLAADHSGMKVDYRGLFSQVQRAIKRSDPGYAEMLRQLEGHLQELGQRWYAGDTNVVDEMLQLYCIERDARQALPKLAAAPQAQADAVLAKVRQAYTELSRMFHDQIVGQQAAWIEWQHGKGAEEGMSWIESGLCGPGHIPDEEAPYGTEAQAWFDANKSNPFPACPCGRPSNILSMGHGFCSNEHYDAHRAAIAAAKENK